ncbi:ATP-grasp domain-containing protein [Corynebacterium poyangense]|uniref:ATP-grasp domain-containing protein n=1 Tax=Corynebacterium poyangense TaxID=2684405 RepID=UPI00165D2E24|nr:ATP-grasp domain-containing protein [Corynebacterium poyangense]
MSVAEDELKKAEWALLVGVTTTGSHAADQWFRGFLQACRQRNLLICGIDFEESLRDGVPRIPLDCLITLPGAFSRDITSAHLITAISTIRQRCPGSVVASAALRENYQLLNSRFAKELHITANTPECIQLIQDKPACRARLHQAGFYQPRSLRIRGVGPGDTIEFEDVFGCRVSHPSDNPRGWIVKPATGMGSIGVEFISSLDEISALNLSLSDDYCCEEFIEGDEFSIEGLVTASTVRVYAVTEKTTNERFVETGHRQPAGTQQLPNQAELEQEFQDCITALGIQCGHLHAEFWRTPEGTIVWGEFHVRQGGDLIAPDLVTAIRPELDYYGELIDSLRGLPLPPLPPIRYCAGVRFIEVNAGMVQGISVRNTLPPATKVYWQAQPLEHPHAVNSSTARGSVLFSYGRDQTTVNDNLNQAENLCKIEVAQLSNEGQ